MASEAPSSTFKRLQNKKSLRNQEVNPGPHGSEAPVPPTERKHSASVTLTGLTGFFPTGNRDATRSVINKRL